MTCETEKIREQAALWEIRAATMAVCGQGAEAAAVRQCADELRALLAASPSPGAAPASISGWDSVARRWFHDWPGHGANCRRCGRGPNGTPWCDADAVPPPPSGAEVPREEAPLCARHPDAYVARHLTDFTDRRWYCTECGAVADLLKTPTVPSRSDAETRCPEPVPVLGICDNLVGHVLHQKDPWCHNWRPAPSGDHQEGSAE
jgi:hypothetical protein